jgi:hypothetical protein
LCEPLFVTALPFGVWFGFSFGGDLPVERGKAVEEELGDVSKGDGVLAIDALEGDVAEEVAEEEVDGVGSGEIVQVLEKGFGDGFVLAALAGDLLAGVVRAESGVRIRGEHAATGALDVNVGAREGV